MPPHRAEAPQEADVALLDHVEQDRRSGSLRTPQGSPHKDVRRPAVERDRHLDRAGADRDLGRAARGGVAGASSSAIPASTPSHSTWMSDAVS